MTPNSFSDSGYSLSPDHLSQQLSFFLSRKDLIPDIGFESTAPMNSPITAQEERERFNAFLELSKNFSFNDKLISFDTYRVDNFLYMAHKWREVHPQAQFIFNDISGVLDHDLKQALKEEKFYYVYTFSHIPDRLHVHDHMKHLSTEDIVEQTLQAFRRSHDFFIQNNKSEFLILDPGFGFSKTFEQNWQLLNNLWSIVKVLKKEQLNHPLLIGLSKKSFLRKALKTESFSESEFLHFKCLVDLMQIQDHHLLFRVHDPRIVDLARQISPVKFT